MSDMKKSYYKYCIVPLCKNTTTKSNKIFFSVPKDPNIRKIWTKAMKRNEKLNRKLSHKSSLFVCEDHFSLKDDMENYMEWQLTKDVKRLMLIRGRVPHRFECQNRINPSTGRKGLKKRKQISLTEEAIASPGPSTSTCHIKSPKIQISIKKEEDSSSEETSIITDVSGKAIGQSTLKVGMFSDAEPVIIKEEFSESLLKDALPEDSLDEIENARTGNKLDDKKQYSENTPLLPFRIKKEVPTVKLKEEPTSFLDKTGNQGFVSDPSSLDLQTGKMSVNTYPKKKNARRLSTDEKNSQRKK